MVTKVYLVRHAEATGNTDETFQGHTDCDISPKGEEQLKALSERFKDVEYDIIYSSPLIRTMKTAEAVNHYHNAEIIKNSDIIEINGGVFEGRKWAELPILFPKSYDLWINKLHAFEVENGESMIEVLNRMKKAISEIVSLNKGKTIVVVSHGCALKNYLCYAKGLPHEELEQIGWSDNTAVSMLEFDENLTPTIVFMNNSDHLSEETSTLAHQKWWRTEQTDEV